MTSVGSQTCYLVSKISPIFEGGISVSTVIVIKGWGSIRLVLELLRVEMKSFLGIKAVPVTNTNAGEQWGYKRD